MRDYIHYSESELVEGLNHGDERAFLEIYRRFKDPLASNLLRILKSTDLAEEVLQEIFLGLWERRNDIDSERALAPYLFKSALNRTKNVFRRLAYDARMREIVYRSMIEQQKEFSQDWLEKGETRKIVNDLLLKLPEQQRKVYTLCKLEGLSYKEVGSQLGIAETTVNTHIRNANRILRHALRERKDLGSMVYLAVLLSLI